jgi:hypothetical protein
MSRIVLPLPLLVLALAACSPAPDEQQQAVAQSEQRAEAAATTTPDAAAPVDANACDATQAQWVVGKTPTEADTEQARKDAGATGVRLLKPDQAVTMEFNAARLNVEVDEKGVAVSVRCG